MKSYRSINPAQHTWMLAPVALVLLFAGTALLAFQGTSWALWGLALQMTFYTFAVVGWISGARANPMSRVAFYFTFMHYSVLVGMFSFLRGKTSVNWKKAKRLETGLVSISD